MEVDPTESSCQQLADQETTTKKNDEEEESAPVNNLAFDYSEIAMLTQKLNTQIQVFTTTMNEMVDSIPSYDNLSNVWDEMLTDDNNDEDKAVGEKSSSESNQQLEKM